MEENREQRLEAALRTLLNAAEPALGWGYGQLPHTCAENDLESAIQAAKQLLE